MLWASNVLLRSTCAFLQLRHPTSSCSADGVMNLLLCLPSTIALSFLLDCVSIPSYFLSRTPPNFQYFASRSTSIIPFVLTLNLTSN